VEGKDMNPPIEKNLAHSSMPLVDTMNETVPSFISWCTPSIPDDVAQVRGVYKDDISASFHSIGSFLSNSGIFREAQELAADAFGADTTLFFRQRVHRFELHRVVRAFHSGQGKGEDTCDA